MENLFGQSDLVYCPLSLCCKFCSEDSYFHLQFISQLSPAFMQVAYLPDGLEAIIFTADGDMRQALNNLQVGCSEEKG